MLPDKWLYIFLQLIRFLVSKTLPSLTIFHIFKNLEDYIAQCMQNRNYTKIKYSFIRNILLSNIIILLKLTESYLHKILENNMMCVYFLK